MDVTPDPVRLEVFRNLFAAVAEEMGVALRRTSDSPNIRERRDYSCAIFDADGRLVAQGEHMPVHIGSMPMAVRAAIEAVDPGPGDVVMLNDPYHGGTHLPDVTLVAGVFREGRSTPAFYVASRAHHADIGGMTPGSMPLSRSIFQEGLRIPPVRLVRGGEIDDDLLALVRANVRTPDEREGDLTAQIAACRTGGRRVAALCDRYGDGEVTAYAGHLLDHAERTTRAALHEIPDGTYRFEDSLDDDGLGHGPLPIRLALTVGDGVARFDFEGTHPQVPGCVNANRAITLSAVMYCVRAIVPFDVPCNAGTMRPIEVVTPPGSLLDPRLPAAVAGGNVETSQRIVDVVLGALHEALPGRVPAASSGTMTNLTIGGVDPRTGEAFAYYETTAGGMGACPDADGLDAIHTHMTNSSNTPIEALEHAYPFRVRRYAIRSGSGGAGRFRGGDGIERTIELLTDAEVTLLSDRRRTSPYSLAGGSPGAAGEAELRRPDGEVVALPGKASVEAAAGSVLTIRTPGGGGYGSG